MNISTRLIHLLIFTGSLVLPFPGLSGGTRFDLAEVTPGNYLHRGIHAGLEDPEHDDIANLGFIIGDNCIAVIDTGGSISTGRMLLEHIHAVTQKPVCYVINTHVHFDHVLGNYAFVDEKPEFVGHTQLADAIVFNRDFFLERFSDDLGENPTADSIIGPTRVVTGSMVIDLGNRPLKLVAYKTAHSHTDLTVYDEKTRTLWTGDLVFRERIPVLDGSLKGWLSALEDIKGMDADYIIPGHGQGGSSYETVVTRQETYLKKLLDDTRAAINNGMFIEEAIDSIATDEKDNWLLFDQVHKANVSKAFIELEWE